MGSPSLKREVEGPSKRISKIQARKSLGSSLKKNKSEEMPKEPPGIPYPADSIDKRGRTCNFFPLCDGTGNGEILH